MSEPNTDSAPERITAEDFWTKFAFALRATLAEGRRWPAIYRTSAEWTVTVELACKRTGEALGFSPPREYYCQYMKVDCGFFRIILPEEFPWCNWDWEVAIEYENNPNGWNWLEEFTRLTHLNAGLKVLITYVRFRSPGDDPCLSALHEAQKLYHQRKYRQPNDNWLFILGPRHTDLTGGDEIDFRAFSWTGSGEFVELPSQSIIPSLK